MRRRLLLAAASFPFLAACSPKVPQMTAEETQRIKTLISRMQTRCIGRFLIDLPDAFVLNPVRQAEIDEVRVQSEPMPEKAVFDLLLSEYKKKLNHIRHIPEGHEFLRAVYPIDGGLIFDRSKRDVTSRSERCIEARWWSGGFAFTAEVDAFDLTFPEDLHNKTLKQLKTRTDVAEKIATLRSVIARIRGRREDEIPQEPGDCFAHGLWLGPQAENAEFYVNYHLRDAPDVYINLSSVSGEDGPRPETGLMQRRADIERQAKHAGIEFLRFTTRQLHGVAYEESIGREPKEVTGARVPGHTAILQTDQAAQGRQAPFVAVEMFNGHYIPWPERSLEEAAKVPELQRATLSEAEVIALWDAITATLRPRPGAF
ncbi:MAG: T6SS immunity protein Tli4 family protein [Pseudomonadales bacterium]|nr:T6SS immunity protein Tli4 family protein [Pseudomonadales bacterium]